MSNKTRDQCHAVHLHIVITLQRENKDLMQTAWEHCDSSVQTRYQHVCYLDIFIMESTWRKRRELQLLGRRREMERMRDTWEIATCFCSGSEFWISGCFGEILMRAGVNRACMQSRFLQLADATDHLSGSYTISQLWPACTWLSRAEGCEKQQATDAAVIRCRGGVEKN